MEAKRQCLGLAVYDKRMIHTTPPIPGCRIVTQGWASTWSDQNTVIVHLPLGKTVDTPNLLTLPKLYNLPGHTSRMTKFSLVVFKQ